MKKALLIPLIAMTMSLTGCFESDPKEYATPELFLSHVVEVHRYITVESSEISDRHYLDYGLVIKDKILEISGFESVSKTEPTTEKYMVYKQLLSLSNAGPNYSYMYIYDDGLTRIEFKQALGKVKNLYFACDSSEAHELNIFVENRINFLIENDKQAEELGKKETNIENYFTYMESATSPYVIYYTSERMNSVADKGEFLSTLKEVTYTKTDELRYFNSVVDFYQDDSIPVYGEGNKPKWNFRLDSALDFIRVEHAFLLNDVPYLSITCYTISVSDGNKILEKAQELIKNRN